MSASTELVVARWRQPELLLATLVAGLGVLCVVEATRIPANAATRGPIGSSAMPAAVGVLLLVAAVLIAVDILRGGVGEMEGGEDVALDQPADWKALGLIVLVFVGNAVLIDVVGWPVSGAVLFLGASVALGSRHPVRDTVLAITLSLASYFLFARGLGINLPAGVLEGVL